MLPPLQSEMTECIVWHGGANAQRLAVFSFLAWCWPCRHCHLAFVVGGIRLSSSDMPRNAQWRERYRSLLEL
jgi:hypothetical protein